MRLLKLADHQKSLLRRTCAVFLASLILVLAQAVAVPPKAKAQMGFSIPGFKQLKRQLQGLQKGKKKRRSKNTRSDNSLEDSEPTDWTYVSPPLPRRNPERRNLFSGEPVRTAKKAKKHRSGKPKPVIIPLKIPKRSLERKQPIGNIETAEAPADAKEDLPPLPVRRPHRHPSKIKTPDWSPEIIAQATEECLSLLGKVEIKAARLKPIREGRCGAPAPMLLTHFFKKDSIEVKPAATISCPMIAELESWLREDVQPLALEHLGQRVVSLANASSYVCRNRYGDTTKRISEHAYANALDISAFILENGERVTLTNHWDDEENGRGPFLKALHKTACKHFGTVLGPESNAAHKDHFHLDMRPRRRSNYCR
jgi:hypothetical protein